MGKHCKECPYYKEKVIVPYEGKPADIMIVGESPGRQEIKARRPFIGKSGEVLNAALDYIGLSRGLVYIANSCKCMIDKENDTTKDINKALACCRKYLVEVVEKIKPRLIICLGAVAYKQVLGGTNILKNRGRFFHSEELDTDVFVTVHPAYILRGASRGYPDKPVAKMTMKERIIFSDFDMVLDYFKGNKDGHYRAGDIIDIFRSAKPTFRDRTENYALVKDITLPKGVTTVAVDYETNSLDHFSKDFKILSISMSWIRGKSNVVLIKNNKLPKGVKKILQDSKIKKIIASSPFEQTTTIVNATSKFEGPTHDVLEIAHLIDENGHSYSLETLADTYTDLKNIKAEAQGMRTSLESADPDILRRYNGIDTDATLRVYEVLTKFLKQDKALTRYYVKFIMPAQELFKDMHLHGCKFDTDKWVENKEKAEQMLMELHDEAISKIPKSILRDHEGKKISLTRDALIRDYLFNHPKGLRLKPNPEYLTAKTRQPQCSEDHLKLFKHIPFVEIYLKWKKLAKVYTSYLSTLPQAVKGDGLVHPVTFLNRTVSGRSVILGPAIQTIPQRNEYAYLVRELFVAERGWRMCALDLAQSEMRIVGWLAQDKNILRALDEGVDLHSKTAAVVNSVSIDKVTKEMRQRAKCFHPNTEVLTRKGWVKFSDYNGTDEIMTAEPIDNRGVNLKWDTPLHFELKPNHCDTLVSLSNEGVDIKVTPDHRMLGMCATGKFYVATPKEINRARYIYNAGDTNDGFVHIEHSLLRFIVAVQADGSFIRNVHKELTGVRFGFTKKRKIKRLLKILDKLPFTYRYVRRPVNGKTGHFVTVRVSELPFLTKDKTFSWSLLNLTHSYRQIFIEELQYWVSCKQDNWKHFRYGTSKEVNADIVQAVCSITGCKAIKLKTSSGWYVSVKQHPYSHGEAIHTQEQMYKDEVAVLSVPSTFVLVRYNGKTLITGQCVNFGFIYGMSAKGFQRYAKDAYGLDYTMEECEQIRAAFFSKPDGYYSLPVFYAYQEAFVKKHGFIRTPLGRLRRLPEAQTGDFKAQSQAVRQAINTPVQSFSSDLGIIGTFLFNDEIKKNPTFKDKVRPIFFIHDATMFLAKTKLARKAMLLLKECITERTKDYIWKNFKIDVSYPIEVDGKVGTNWNNLKEIDL